MTSSRRVRLFMEGHKLTVPFPIDTFFSSLAEDQEDNAICIVLAGTGSDGTLGLKLIKENGGLTLAQAGFRPHCDERHAV